jgi:tetratricopeptide (TPR) repeat protein
LARLRCWQPGCAPPVDRQPGSRSIELALLPLRQLARVLLAQGRLNHLDRITQEALWIAAASGQRSPLVGYTYLSLGQLWYERNDLVAAGRYFADGLALVELGGARDVLNLMNLADAHLGLARLKQTQGDPRGALELTQRIIPIWEQLARALQQRGGVMSPTPSERQAEPGRSQLGVGTLYADRIAACRVWLWLSQGNIAAASRLAQSWKWDLEGEITYFNETRLIALARVLIAQRECERALALLARLLNTKDAGRTGQAIELLALQALAQHAHGQIPEALSALENALVLAEPEGYIRTFEVSTPTCGPVAPTAPGGADCSPTLQGPTLLLIAPLILSYFVGAAWLSAVLAREGVVSKWNPRLYAIALGVGVLAALLARVGGASPQMLGLVTLGAVSAAQIWVGMALLKLADQKAGGRASATLVRDAS